MQGKGTEMTFMIVDVKSGGCDGLGTTIGLRHGPVYNFPKLSDVEES